MFNVEVERLINVLGQRMAEGVEKRGRREEGQERRGRVGEREGVEVEKKRGEEGGRVVRKVGSY